MLRLCLLHYHHPRHYFLFLFLRRHTLTTAFVPLPLAPTTLPLQPLPLFPSSTRKGKRHVLLALNHPRVLPCVCASARVCGDAVTCGRVTNAHDHNYTEAWRSCRKRQEGAVRRRTLSTPGHADPTPPPPSNHPGRGPLSLPLLHLLRLFCFGFCFIVAFF